MRTSWPDAPELPHRAKPHHSEKTGYDEMSLPGTPVLGNDTLTLPLNPNRFRKSPSSGYCTGAPWRPLREGDEGACIHPGAPTAYDNYREVNCALSTVRPSKPSDCIRVAIRSEPPAAASAVTPLYGQVPGTAPPRSKVNRRRQGSNFTLPRRSD